MSDPVTTPKPQRGRPRKVVPIVQEEGTVLSHDSGHEIVESAEMVTPDGSNEPVLSAADTEENTNDLAVQLAELSSLALSDLEEQPVITAGQSGGGDQDDEIVRLPNGDVVVAVVVREIYTQAMIDQAHEKGVTLDDHVQTLLDWWMEQEFSVMPRV